MSLAPQYIADAKFAGIVIGLTIGGIILLGILSFLLYELFFFFRGVWGVMFRDRAQYLLDEKARAAWNAEYRREARLCHNAMAVVTDWAQKNGIVEEGSPMELSALVRGL
jgi:hypothetical protein